MRKDAIAVLIIILVMLLAGLVDRAAGAPPGPEMPNGRTVRPTMSYTYTTFATTGEPMIVRVPLRGHRRATLRYGGVL